MGLFKEYFEAIQSGKKTVEVRLNDAKRRNIHLGDAIEFVCVPEQNETFLVQVIDLQRYDTFREMYEHIPFRYFDCEGWSMQEMLEGTYEIYSPEQEKQWGTLAITIKYPPVAGNY